MTNDDGSSRLSSPQVDLTPFVNSGGDNVIAIRVDNPENSSRWYPGGSIYRNVWLEKTSPVRVDRWGAFLTTPQISAESASIEIKTKIANRGTRPAEVQVATQIFKLSASGSLEGGALASSAAGTLTIPPGAAIPVTNQLRRAKHGAGGGKRGIHRSIQTRFLGKSQSPEWVTRFRTLRMTPWEGFPLFCHHPRPYLC